jgi:hypothetical protein
MIGLSTSPAMHMKNQANLPNKPRESTVYETRKAATWQGTLAPNSQQHMQEEDRVDSKGFLLKRKDFLGIDEKASSHPNRTYYFKRSHDVEGIIDTCSKKLQVSSYLN